MIAMKHMHFHIILAEFACSSVILPVFINIFKSICLNNCKFHVKFNTCWIDVRITFCCSFSLF